MTAEASGLVTVNGKSEMKLFSVHVPEQIAQIDPVLGRGH